MLKTAMPELSTSFNTVQSNDAEPRRIAYLENVLGIAFTQGNAVRPLNNGDEIYPAMLTAIESSRDHIEFLTFIYWQGDIAQRFADALSERAKNGVTVRVLLDAFGCADMSKDLVDEMTEAGVKVHWFRQIRRSIVKYDWRTHRKILVCDGRIAYTGGVGIAAEWEGNARNANEWRETHFEIRGPAVKMLSGAFWDNWGEDADIPTTQMTANPSPRPRGIPLQVISSNSGYRVSNAYKVLHAMISLATKRIDIVSPYFVPEENLRAMLCAKAKAGVEVRVMIPDEHTDKRFERREAARYFGELLEAGVRIFLYRKTMIHTKLILCDDDIALFGSINFNRRSLLKDEEIGVVAASRKFVADLRKIYETDLRDTHRVNPHEWQGPSALESAFHCIAAPFRNQF
ncbi:MAG: phospholipase D-like domain-containing protein [Puniceicoccales bacterium]